MIIRQSSKIAVGILLVLGIATGLSAEWKMNPYTGKSDYYDPGNGHVIIKHGDGTISKFTATTDSDTSRGGALLSSMSATNTWADGDIVSVSSGTYDIGANSFRPPNYGVLEGQGMEQTTILSSLPFGGGGIITPGNHSLLEKIHVKGTLVANTVAGYQAIVDYDSNPPDFFMFDQVWLSGDSDVFYFSHLPAANGSSFIVSNSRIDTRYDTYVTLHDTATSKHYFINTDINNTGFSPTGGSGGLSAGPSTLKFIGGSIYAANGKTYTRAVQSIAGGSIELMGTRLTSTITQQPAINSLTYDGNGNTGGTVPVDSTLYSFRQTAMVLDNTGSLVKTGYSFDGWATDPTSTSGIAYLPFVPYTVYGNFTLYAVWKNTTTYTVTYDGNGATGGTIPVDSTHYIASNSVTVLGNIGNLVNTGYVFSGWNTQAGGGGTTYAEGKAFSAANTTLYARWTNAATHTVTYNANGAASGSVPVDTTNYQVGQTVTAKYNTGNLTLFGYAFTSWNTTTTGYGTSYAVGTGSYTMSTADVTWYAQWTPIVPAYDLYQTAGSILTSGCTYSSLKTAGTITYSGNMDALKWNALRFNNAAPLVVPAGDKVIGTDGSTVYECTTAHTSSPVTRPTTGASWATKWTASSGTGIAWSSVTAYRQKSSYENLLIGNVSCSIGQGGDDYCAAYLMNSGGIGGWRKQVVSDMSTTISVIGGTTGMGSCWKDATHFGWYDPLSEPTASCH